ncbi:PLP-dependent aminotransferase family protein [Gordonia sp. PDNC005]|jgi:DNA-binding transcriptional MocR family regulator|uniref:aminotransferase-like domain-containing protein n=1 Tax=unclassified Gordonia (in: high G+C Gram-positive bacteria) TaxID=2657482 RepID=UPI0019631FDF|nr:PLP-dependent aminotransferase family protein [Gordonia sp. PDNC005]QRY64235.1 PLP-dependent aminotransferase family protein [Gordonia sp. PDNC005]
MSKSSSERLVDALEKWVAAADAGAQLPSTRRLVTDHEVSPVTVQKALRTLSDRGLVETRTGVGTFVRPPRTAKPHDYGWQTAALGSNRRQLPEPTAAPLRTIPNDVISLHSGYPDRELLPERLVTTALSRAARSDHAFTRPPTAGLPELQAWFAADLGRRTPSGCTPPTPSDVIVLPGSQAGLAALFRTLVGPGGPLIIESPTYWGAILAAAQAGVDLVPVPSGPNGPDPDELDRAFVESGARVFYAQPTYSNPTGAQWDRDLADTVLGIVASHGAYVIEDDWAHDFGISSDPTPLALHDDGGHVVYLRSLTKSVSPSVRVAGLVARGPVRNRVLADVAAQSMYVSAALQTAAVDVVTAPGWQSHLRSVRNQLGARRDLLVESLRRHAPSAHLDAVPDGGLNLWLRLPDPIDVRALVRDCESDGLVVAAGDEWFPTEPTGPFLRLNYSGPNPGAFEDAAQILGRRLGD